MSTLWCPSDIFSTDVPAGSLSRGGDVAVYVFWHKPTELAHSFCFCSWCLCMSLHPFQLYFVPKILPTSLRFLTLFFRSFLCLISPFNYNISPFESLPKLFVKYMLLLFFFCFSGGFFLFFFCCCFLYGSCMAEYAVVFFTTSGSSHRPSNPVYCLRYNAVLWW